jgi:hypothetical protein
MKPSHSWSAVVLLALFFMLAPASAEATPPNPPTNLEIGSLPSYCYGTKRLPTCENGVIYYLDQARATMGLGPYALPANFLMMSPAQQMFILSNLDRIAYALPPIEGLTDGLDLAAEEGARSDSDPEPSEAQLGRPYVGWASNWAGAFPSTMEAYFFWMYADGYGSGNDACKAPADSGCWGHRRNILWAVELPPGRPNPYIYSIGAAAIDDQSGAISYAMTVVGSNISSPPPYSYTWAQAVAEGAGSNPYPVSLPVEEKVRLTIVVHGHGMVSGAGATCLHTCHREVIKYNSLALRALPATTGFRFTGWRGCTIRRHGFCELEPEADGSVSAEFVRRKRHRHRHHHRHRAR